MSTPELLQDIERFQAEVDTLLAEVDVLLLDTWERIQHSRALIQRQPPERYEGGTRGSQLTLAQSTSSNETDRIHVVEFLRIMNKAKLLGHVTD
jgi:hypothetical protein